MVTRKKVLIALLVGSIIFLLIAVLISMKRSTAFLQEIKAPKTENALPGKKDQQPKADEKNIIEVPVPVKIKGK